MAFEPARTYVRNPRQTAKTFFNVPKQRNVFIVRFYANGAQIGVDQTDLRGMTFVAKSVDRPKISPKTEELHQYNKKRQVHTGFKVEPVRMQLYDDARSTALTMWQDYAKYYFGDFDPKAAFDYRYDVISQEFSNNGSGFGFTGANRGTTDGEGDFYFDRMEIYHLYQNPTQPKQAAHMYDVYVLTHPRITGFDPDELSYENSDVAMISMTVNYENLKYVLQQTLESGDTQQGEFYEFNSGWPFDGETMPAPGTTSSITKNGTNNRNTSSATSVDRLLMSAQGLLTDQVVAPYRYNGDQSTGSLDMFGDFSFGPKNTSDLTALAQQNGAFATALDLGSSVDPLTVTRSVQGTTNAAARRGVDAGQMEVSLGRASAVTTPYGTATSDVTTSLMASDAINSKLPAGGDAIKALDNWTKQTNEMLNGGDVPTISPAGLVLSLEGYGSMNARQDGTAQYGFKTRSDRGYGGPTGSENDGPYLGGHPSGLYGRYGISDEFSVL